MNDTDIKRLAREAGLPIAWISETGVLSWNELAYFAGLIEAAERERCAALCDGTAGVCEDIANGIKRTAGVSAAKSCARLIRGQTDGRP